MPGGKGTLLPSVSGPSPCFGQCGRWAWCPRHAGSQETRGGLLTCMSTLIRSSGAGGKSANDQVSGGSCHLCTTQGSKSRETVAGPVDGTRGHKEHHGTPIFFPACSLSSSHLAINATSLGKGSVAPTGEMPLGEHLMGLAAGP